MNRLLSLTAVFLALTLPALAQEIGTVTLLEGKLRLIRGATVLQGAEGVRLHAGDIIESSSPGFVQVELAGGAIIALGGSSRVYILSFSHAAGKKAAVSAEFVLLSGWLKGESGSNTGVYRYDCPLLAASTQDGTLVMNCTAEASEVFVESGSAHVGEVGAGGNWRDPRSVKAGEFISRAAGKQSAVSSRPDAPFVDSMPHQFRDTLSSLSSRFSGKPPQPKRDHEVTYAEIGPWLTIAQAWRRGFVTRFQVRLHDPTFRRELEAHLKNYPEWEAALHPELYQQKTSPTATGTPNASNGRDTN